MSEDCSVLTHPDNREVCALAFGYVCILQSRTSHIPLHATMKIVLRMLSERVRVDSQVEGVEEVGK